MPLSRLTLQLTFTAAVTLASLVFIVSPTTSSELFDRNSDIAPSYGSISVSSRMFDPAQYSPHDFNDQAYHSSL